MSMFSCFSTKRFNLHLSFITLSLFFLVSSSYSSSDSIVILTSGITTLTDEHQGTIIIKANDVILNLNGNMVYKGMSDREEGILLDKNSNISQVTIRNGEIIGNYRDGICAQDLRTTTTNVTIDGIVIQHALTGIGVNGDNINLTVNNTQIYDGETGIWAYNGSNVDINNVTIHTSEGYGILIEYINNFSLNNINLLRNGDNYGTANLCLFGSSNGSVGNDAYIHYGKGIGVEIVGCNNITFDATTWVFDNEGCGFSLDEHSTNITRPHYENVYNNNPDWCLE